MSGVMGMRTRGRERSQSEAPRAVWFGVFAAVSGAVLISIGALWLVFSTGTAVGADGGLVGALIRIAGPAGVALTTASMFGMYALLVAVREPAAILVGMFGALITVLSLIALIWIVTHQPPLASSSAGIESSRLLAVSSLMVSWIRPIGILAFGLAAVLADLRGPWEHVLFTLGVLETPLPALLLLYLTGPTVTAGWPVLVFGLPGVQPGLVGAFFWLILGYALFISGQDLKRRRRRRRSGYRG
jgi:hypothetical protein